MGRLVAGKKLRLPGWRERVRIGQGRSLQSTLFASRTTRAVCRGAAVAKHRGYGMRGHGCCRSRGLNPPRLLRSLSSDRMHSLVSRLLVAVVPVVGAASAVSLAATVPPEAEIRPPLREHRSRAPRLPLRRQGWLSPFRFHTHHKNCRGVAVRCAKAVYHRSPRCVPDSLQENPIRA